MSNDDKIIKELKKGNEVYLYEDYQDAVIRIVPGKKARFFAKLKSGGEYPIKESTNLVTEAFLGGKIITQEEYYNF